MKDILKIKLDQFVLTDSLKTLNEIKKEINDKAPDCIWEKDLNPDFHIDLTITIGEARVLARLRNALQDEWDYLQKTQTVLG